jgi:hypothetical protein
MRTSPRFASESLNDLVTQLPAATEKAKKLTTPGGRPLASSLHPTDPGASWRFENVPLTSPPALSVRETRSLACLPVEQVGVDSGTGTADGLQLRQDLGGRVGRPVLASRTRGAHGQSARDEIARQQHPVLRRGP